MDKQAIESQPSKDQVGSLDLIAILNRRKAWLFLSCLIGLGVGSAYFFLSPKRFESRAELLLTQNDPEQMSSTNTSERDVSEELLATHIKLVQSSRIVRDAMLMDEATAKKKAKIDEEDEEADSQSETDTQEDGMDSSGEKTDADTRGKEAGDPTPSAAPAASPEQEKANPPQGAGELISGLSPTEAIFGGQISSKSEMEGSDTESKATESDLISSEDKSDEIDNRKLPDDKSSVDHLYQLKSITELLSEDTTPTDYVIKNMYVTTGGSGRARNARVLNIAFRHTSEEDCQTITRAIVNRYQEFVKSKFKDINTDAHTLIEKAKKDLEKEISDLEAEYKKFRDRAPLLSRGATGTDIYTTRYEELAAEFSQLAIQRDEAAGRLEMVKTSLTDFNKSGAHSLQKLALIDQGNAERLGILVTVERGKAETAAFQSTQPERMAGATAEYSQLLTLKTRLSQLTADFGPEYPEVKALRQQIGEMEGFLSKKQKELFIGEDVQLTPDDVMKAYVSMLDHDLRALDQRSQDIDKQMQIAEQKAKALVTEQLEDESLIRARERKEELYDAVVQRLRDLNLKKDQTPLILELIQEPTYPEKVEPKGVIAAAISALCALLVGGAGVLVAELKDRSVHSPEEFEEMLGSRVLAHLPNFQNDAEIRKLQRVARKQKSPLSPSLLTFYAPDSRASETFRALRTQVMFSAGGDHKILATTSSNQGAGKSMLSSNMAISMAGLGSNVLLIDCDMRLPQVHRLFGVSNEKGLADAIAHPEMVDSLVVPSGVPNLTLLPSGQSPANPAELLSRPECKELLESLRQKYAYIILDCPPVLAVSDPSILAPMADGVLFVSVVDSESRPKTLRAKRILEGVNAKIIGIVVNRSDESSQRYGYQAYGYESTGATDSYYAARPVR